MVKLFEAYSARHLKLSAFSSVTIGGSASSGLTFVDEEYEVYEDSVFKKYMEMVVVTRDHIESSNELNFYLMESVEYQTLNSLLIECSI